MHDWLFIRSLMRIFMKHEDTCARWEKTSFACIKINFMHDWLFIRSLMRIFEINLENFMHSL